jgi:hypothetical protein
MPDLEFASWTEAFLALSEADRAKAQWDYLHYGTAFIRIKDDGSAEYVPLVDVYKTESEKENLSG